MVSIALVIPQIKYAEQIMAFRQEMLCWNPRFSRMKNYFTALDGFVR